MTRIEARTIRAKLEQAAQHIPEIEAYDVVWMYPKWASETEYAAGTVCSYEDGLWKCRQKHISQSAFAPSVYAASLWELLPFPEEDGTRNNPIAFSPGMALEKDKYYSQDGEVYLCTRDTGIPVYNDLNEMAGLYVVLIR